jgi:hypothetical protein
VAPSSAGVETTSWLTSAYLAGSVAGTAAGGVIAQHGSTTSGFLAAVAGAGVAAIIALVGRDSLE